MKFGTAPTAAVKVQSNYSDAAESCANSNFLKGVAWSPDGACLLTASDDNRLRVFDLPADVLDSQGLGDATESALSGIAAAADSAAPPVYVQEGETIYDYAWYSGMAVADPATCCFVTTCRAHPIHLWDVCTGKLRCSYRAFDDKDEVTASNSVTFSPDGCYMAAGANKVIRLFSTAVPGAHYRSKPTHTKKNGGQPGIISCLAFNPDNSGLIAAGAYSGVAALYDAHTLAPAAVMSGGHTAGITKVMWSPDGNFLYSGARQDPRILCWDVRNSGQVLYAMHRSSGTTNQRLDFDIEPCGRHLATGGVDGQVRLFDLTDGSEVARFPAGHDTVNGCRYHPFLSALATASGHRRFDALLPESESESEDEQAPSPSDQNERLSHAPELCNALVVWRLDASWMAQEAGDANTEDGVGDAGQTDPRGAPETQTQ